MRTMIFISLLIFAANGAMGQKNIMKQAIEIESPINIPSEEVRKLFTPPPSFNQLKSATETMSEFVIDFINFPEDAKTAFMYAVSIWENSLSSTVPIKVQAIWEPIDANILAKSRPALNYVNFNGAVVLDVYYPVALAEKLSGVEMNGDGPDIICSFSQNAAWYFGTDGNTPTTKYDFATVVLHELAHGLGFSGYLKVENNLGFYNNASNLPGIFDYCVYNNLSQQIADNSLFQSPSSKLKTQLTSNNLISYSTYNKNFPAKLFAPTTWKNGSSLFHLNESDFNAEDGSGLMTPYTYKGEAIHTPGKETLEILSRIGWKTVSFKYKELKDIEAVSTPIPVNISVVSDLELNNSSVKIIFSTNYFSTSDSVNLKYDETTNLFSGNISLNGLSGKILYYFKAETTEKQVFTSPSGAPGKNLSFRIGPDYYPPNLLHNQIKIASQSPSLIDVSAIAEDNVGVNSVRVEYKIDGAMQDPFFLTGNLNDDSFNGTLDIPAQLSASSILEYRIVAEDKSARKNSKSAPSNGFYLVDIFELEDPVSGYFSDFNSELTDFVSTDFFASIQPGFSSGLLHTKNPYPVSYINDEKQNFTAQLKFPIILEENGQMTFDEIVLVEPGEEGASFTDNLFWDYVIVEGSNDNGATWLPFVDGYDSGVNESWKSKFTNTIVNDFSKASGEESMFLKRFVNLTNNTNFSAGDIVLIRFRLASDKSVNGWGWGIDNLEIQSLSTSTDELMADSDYSFYPNPFTSSFYIDCANADGLSEVDITVTDLLGKTVFRETWYDTQFNPLRQVDLSGALPGVYLVRVMDDELNMVTNKIIKTRYLSGKGD
ncbi:MAG: T9SS type A sorting domain-containing protein [Prolixibacteraceae bacterium]|nr:T9SS type A sorting domain-containing protein [Prolixibacteraceae bacterium]MBT6004660.1 T9SS type A sorting domain-containing protein [Prolixibacteraceae bacterium]MBT6765978.1 T9SS type A sorting domain-containing protein [Prolixibacteraceae bacterium]MBT6996966.1 T9SS type A sorting domain-containing protein [Prolixibacteraceae bacterium]MBT7395370.1 T9SS type A sorting domain-containing protein [Prolixibacteraceae bacterium]